MADNKNDPAGDLNSLGKLGKPVGKTNTPIQNTFATNPRASLGTMAVAATGAAMEHKGTEYEVQWGETLSGIGKRFGVPWREIFEANRDQIKDPDRGYKWGRN